MSDFLVKLKAIPSRLMDVLIGLIDGLTVQIRTARGALIFLVVTILTFDVYTKGSVGVITFSIEQCKIILTAITEVMKTGGWQLIIIALILIMLKRDKK